MQIIYCHGFASSPQSKKANYFKPFFEAKGIGYSIPNLNQPSFETLTLTAILEKVAATVRQIDDDEIVLIGSSMGGLTALHFTDRYRDAEAQRVKQLVLLAPAMQFMTSRDDAFVAQWRERGYAEFYNYAIEGMARVHYGIVEDAKQYDTYSLQLELPILIYHGKNDETVSYGQSVRFAKGRDNVTLNLLDSDHQLLDKTDVIRDGIVQFLGV